LWKRNLLYGVGVLMLDIDLMRKETTT